MPSSQMEVQKKMAEREQRFRIKLKTCYADYGIKDADIEGLTLAVYERHAQYLDDLIKKRKLKPKEAILAIRILKKNQINWVLNGLSIDDAKELKPAHICLLDKNFKFEDIRNLSAFHLDVLIEQFKQENLRKLIQPQHLIKKTWFNDKLQLQALFKILEKNPLYDIEHALSILESLNTYQLEALLSKSTNNSGLDHCEVQGLNKIQIHSLKKLKILGLTHEALRNKEWFVTDNHYAALKALMRNSDFYCHNPNQAVSDLEGLNQTRLFAVSKNIQLETVKILNDYQAILLVLLLQDNTLALDLPTIQECTWFNSREHYLVYKRLLDEAHFKPRAALEKIHRMNAVKLKRVLARPILDEANCCKPLRCTIL